MQVLYGPNFTVDDFTVVALGKFDGVHAGHIKIINTLIDTAKKLKIKSVVYTFDKHPKLVLEKENFKLLMSNEEKTKAFENFMIDYLIYEKFNDEFASLSPETFVKEILIKKLHVKAVVMGENSTFGKDRTGDVKLMQELGKEYGFMVNVVELLTENGEIISSTKIREKILT